MRIPKRGEKGFTLIELLIVIAILGVLAAVVIPNLSRFLGAGEDEAAKTECSNIQSSVLTMMIDQGISEFTDTANLTDTLAEATRDMAVFPCAPYVLYQNTALGETVNYVAANQTKGTYTCDVYGTVNQTLTGYE